MKININIFVLFFTFTISFDVYANQQDDYIALRALYLSTDGDNWTSQTDGTAEWPSQSDFMMYPTTPPPGYESLELWQGVSLDDNGCVDNLSLPDNNLNGNIPPELGNLSNLIDLRLDKNQLSGSIPPNLGSLTNLTALRLFKNQLSGSIPLNLGSLINLTELRLYDNQLNGSIPPELGNLSNLTSLSLYGNQLSGSIPPELGNLSNLTSIGLGDNQLSGSIPPELGNLSNLIYLSLYSNQLSGSIPPELGNLSNLTNLSLYENQLSGNIPPELSNLSNLTSLSLGNNQLSGSIPPELGNLSNLEELYLYQNQLSSNIPPELGNLDNLTHLYLSNNQLSGNIPPELGNLGNLAYLYLGGNQLSGCYDPNLMNLCTQLTNSNIDGGSNMFDATWEDFCNSEAGQCGCNCEAYTTQDQSITGVDPNDLPNSTYRLDLDDSITPDYSGDGDESIVTGTTDLSESEARLNALRLQHHIDCARQCNKAILVSADDIGISHPFSDSEDVSVSDFDQYVNSDQGCQNILNVSIHHRASPVDTVGACTIFDNHSQHGATVDLHMQPGQASIIPILNFSNFYAQVDFTGTRLLVYEEDFRDDHLAWLEHQGAIQINDTDTKDVDVLDEELLSTLQAAYAFPVIVVHNVLDSLDNNCAGNPITNNLGIRNLEIIPRNNIGVDIDQYRFNAFTLDVPNSDTTLNFFGDTWYYPMPGMMLIFEAYRADATTGDSCNKCEHSGISNSFNINTALKNTVTNFENDTTAADFTPAEHDLISQYAHIDNIRISHLSEGIHVYNAHNLILNNLDLFNFSDAGLVLNYSSGCYVLNSRVRYGSDGNCNFAWNICESHLVNSEISANGISGLEEDFRKGQCLNLEGDANRNYIIKNHIHTGYRGVYIKRGSDRNIVKGNSILDINRCVDISTTEDQSDNTIPNIGNEIRNNVMSFADIVDRGNGDFGIAIDCAAETKISGNTWDGGVERPVFTFLNIHEKCEDDIIDLHSSTYLIDNYQSGGGAFLTSGPGLNEKTIDGLIITGNDIYSSDVSCDYDYSRAGIELCGGDLNDAVTGGTSLSNSNITGNSRDGGPISASFTEEQFTNLNTGALGGNLTTNNLIVQLCECTPVDIDNTHQSTFTVYPIPAKDVVIFDVPNIAAADELILYDITGRAISRQAFPQDKQLAVSHLNDGVYIYRIFYENEVYSGKIVVE